MARKKLEPAQAEKPALVPMVRDLEGPPPYRADVHPDEVENYRKGGWRAEGLTDGADR